MISGIITKLYVLQFIFYTILIMILYEGTAKIPILSSLIPNKNKMLLILFFCIGIILFLAGLFSGYLIFTLIKIQQKYKEL